MIDGKMTTKKNLWLEHEKELIAEFLEDLDRLPYSQYLAIFIMDLKEKWRKRYK